MQARIKKQLIEKLNNIHALHKQLKTVSDETVLSVLEKCQEQAVSIGNEIENNIIEDNQIIKCLEEYCEDVYQYSQNSIGIKDLELCIAKAETRIKNLRENYRIVFLPYKAEMWDSMESIWLAAKSDVNCECDVVCVPYFEFNREDKKWKYAYDGERFPSYVQVTPYEYYLLNEMKPDVAYIHYPYDGTNRVTTIHPDYYSDKLKENVGKLVYIPYYVTSGHISDGHKYFPVYKNMDYMIAQSEMFKETCSGMYYYDKILALGSPKIDKVINKCNDTLPEEMRVCMPDEWKDILYDNGTKKKVLMLNTTIGDLLRWQDKLLDKLFNIFNVVKRQDDVSLIWRPHPLLEATIKSMRPELLNKYYELIEFYRQNKIGVFDTLPDISDTIAISDGYIGSDGSSVINMFGLAGKPVFICNNLITDKYSLEQKKHLKIINALPYNEKLYFVSDRFCGLFSVDKDSFCTAEYYGDAKELATINEWSMPWSSIAECRGNIYMAPLMENAVAEYENGEYLWHENPVPKYDIRSLGAAVSCGSSIYFFPWEGYIVWEFNTENNEFICHKDWLVYLWKDMDRMEYMPSVYSYSVCGDKIWITTGFSGRILEINTKSKECMVYNIGTTSSNYTGISVDNDIIWLYDNYNNSLVKWNIYDDIHKIESYPLSIKANVRSNANEISIAYCSLINMGKYIILIPERSDVIIRFNKETLCYENISQEFLNDCDSVCNGYDPQYIPALSTALKIDSERILIQRSYDYKCAVINVCQQEFKEKSVEKEFFVDMSEELYNRAEKSDGFEKGFKTGYFCRREGILFSLEQFIHDISNGRLKDIKQRQLKELENVAVNPGTCGLKVHEYMMKVIKEG